MSKNIMYNAWNYNISSKNNAELTNKELEQVSGGINKKILGTASMALMTMFAPIPHAFATPNNDTSGSTLSKVTTGTIIDKKNSVPKIIKVPKVEWMIAKKSSNGNVIWYRGQKSVNSDEIKYYKAKETITSDPFKALDEKGDALFIEVTDKSEIKDIQKIDNSMRKSAEKLLEQLKKRYEEALKFKLKTLDEFKKLSKDDKLKYLTYYDSDVTKKMLCHPGYPTAFTSKVIGYYTKIQERAEDYFKSLKNLSPEELQKPEYKDLYEEYLSCQDSEYFLNKFAQDNEIDSIYKITLDVLSEIFEEGSI